MLREPVLESENLITVEGISYVGNPGKIMDRYIEEAKLGQPVEFVVTTCPDYSYTYDPATSEKAQYTFEGIGTKSGLVADGIASRMIPIISRLEAAGVHNRLTFLYADTEAYDPDIRAAMGIQQDEFVSRINQSAHDLFRKLYVAYGISGLTTYSNPSVNLMTNFMNPDLRPKCSKILSSIKDSSINGIASSRSELYTRWFRNHPNINMRNPLVYNEFVNCRAKKDVMDHIMLGESLRQLTKGIDGFPSSRSNIVLVTMSDDLLARYFNFSGAHPHVPVIQISKSY